MMTAKAGDEEMVSVGPFTMIGAGAEVIGFVAIKSKAPILC
jgi:serine acetyltransferase